MSAALSPSICVLRLIKPSFHSPANSLYNLPPSHFRQFLGFCSRTKAKMEGETKPPVIHLIPTVNSTIPQLISFLRSSQRTEHFDLVQKILLSKEVSRNKDLELIESKHSQLVQEKVVLMEDLKKCKMENNGVRSDLNKFTFECEVLRDRVFRLDKEYTDRVEGLRQEKRRAEAEVLAWKEKLVDCEQRVSKLEEVISGLFVDEEEGFGEQQGDGANSFGMNQGNGSVANKPLMQDSRATSQVMTSPTTGGGNHVIIDLGDSDDDDKPSSNRTLATCSTSRPGEKVTSRKRHQPEVSSGWFDASNIGDNCLTDAFMDDLVAKARKAK